MLNLGSPGQTAATLAIDLHYHNLNLIQRWNWHRFAKLCAFLKMTVYEVASLAMLPHRTLEEYERTGIMPLNPAHAQSIALILTLLEAHLMRGLSEEIVENPFPSLNKPLPE